MNIGFTRKILGLNKLTPARDPKQRFLKKTVHSFWERGHMGEVMLVEVELGEVIWEISYWERSYGKGHKGKVT